MFSLPNAGCTELVERAAEQSMRASVEVQSLPEYSMKEVRDTAVV